MQGLWHAILNDGYVRVVKNVVEEGCESFGYMLCLTASFGHYRNFRGTRADIILSPVDTLFSFALRTVMSEVSPKMFPAVNALLVLPTARG